MKIGAIVQVRMGSTRLSGKAMKSIEGQPMLWHIVQRLRKSKLIDEIIIATTNKKTDQVIIDLAQQLRLNTYAGSEEDVLDRYYQAAKKYKIDIVVRITSDCPLIDPQIVDRVIATYLMHKNNLDYVNQGKDYPSGCAASEVFPFKVLEKVWREAKSPYEREHVTPYIYRNPQLFRIRRLRYKKDLSYLKLTVDYKRDLKLIREIFHHFGEKLFHLEDVVRLLEDV